MSQEKVISTITKTENSFKTNDGKDMFQYDIVFENDATTYSAYSPTTNYLEKFATGTSVSIEANPSKKMPNKIKMSAAGSGGYAPKSNYGGGSKPAYGTNSSNTIQSDINTQACFKRAAKLPSVRDSKTENVVNEAFKLKEDMDAFVTGLNSGDLKRDYILFNVIQEAVADHLLSDQYLTSDNLIKFTHDAFRNVRAKESAPASTTANAPALDPSFLNTLS